MPVTLTEVQNVTLFQLLDCPYSISYHGVDGMGTLVGLNLATANQASAKTAILADVDALSDNLRTLLITYITDYDSTGSNTGTISGNVDDVTGITWSWDDKRKFLSSKVRSILPYFKYQEILKRQSGEETSRSAFVSVIR